KSLISYEINTRDFSFRAFADLEDKIDPVVIKFDDLSVDLGRVVALPPIDIENALNVRLNTCTRIQGAWFELDFLAEGIGFNLGVPFKGYAIDNRVLNHRDDHHAPLKIDMHVLEKTGPE